LTHSKTFSRAAVMGALAVVALVLAGCSAGTKSPSSGDGSSHLTVGSILLATGGYQSAHDDAMKSYAKSIGVTIKTCSADGAVAKQLACVNDMIAAHVDAVIIQPVDPKAATTMVQQLQTAKIATVTWAVGPVPGVKVPFIPLAEYDQAKAAGEKAAKWVKDNFNESPLIVDLGLPNNTNCTNRETGFIAGAKAADPASKVVAQPNGEGSRLASATVMGDVIASGKKFNIVTGCNGESTLGGLNALKAAGRGKAIDKKPVSEYLFSVDGTPDETTQLVDPKSPLMETLALDPYTNVRVLLDTAIKLQKGSISNSYTTDLKDIPLPTDCAQVNDIIKKAYGTSVVCPSS
jgi:ABC-type sugar transport system substrate-binding protein